MKNIIVDPEDQLNYIPILEFLDIVKKYPNIYTKIPKYIPYVSQNTEEYTSVNFSNIYEILDGYYAEDFNEKDDKSVIEFGRMLEEILELKNDITTHRASNVIENITDNKMIVDTYSKIESFVLLNKMIHAIKINRNQSNNSSINCKNVGIYKIVNYNA